MKTEFIPYEQALELKELGFDEKCLGYYHNILGSTNANLFIKETSKELYSRIKIPEDSYTLAPIYQQAFRWFREKYRLYPEIIYSARDKHWVCQWSDSIGFELLGSYSTYEEAELACLKKLIEIAKNK